MLKAVFLDVDATLVDSNEFHVSAWDEAIHDGGLHASRTDIRHQIGKGADMLLPALFPGIDQARQDEMAHMANCSRPANRHR